jgi:polyphenol oxidase
MSEVMRFPALTGWDHGFICRHPTIAVDVPRAEALERLAPWHEELLPEIAPGRVLHTAEQVHAQGVALARGDGSTYHEAVDGLISADPKVALGIYVADCCAVYFIDQRTGAAGLSHSGKKGSELGISLETLRLMEQHFGTRPQDVVVQLSPCIRPPAYEVDFAANIRRQCADAGVAAVRDTLECTSRDLQRYYSYRVEKGMTGRMLAILAPRAEI